MAIVYNRIKDLREDHDFLQKDIASLLNLHLTQYQRYENGLTSVPFEFIIKLALIYNVSIDYIANLIDYPKKIFEDK